MSPADIATAYWTAMGTNDFNAVAARWLSPDFRLYWPQSNEVITGRADFVAINAAYPAQGPWEFRVNRVTGDANTAVTDTSITDGAMKARAITFHQISGGLITQQIEYWPENYPAPVWRSQWTSPGQPPPDSNSWRAAFTLPTR